MSEKKRRRDPRACFAAAVFDPRYRDETWNRLNTLLAAVEGAQAALSVLTWVLDGEDEQQGPKVDEYLDWNMALGQFKAPYQEALSALDRHYDALLEHEIGEYEKAIPEGA